MLRPCIVYSTFNQPPRHTTATRKRKQLTTDLKLEHQSKKIMILFRHNHKRKKCLQSLYFIQ